MSDGREAEETKDWDRFWGSGRVEDYLRYKNCRQEEEDAGFFAGDGDRDKVYSCRGV